MRPSADAAGPRPDWHLLERWREGDDVAGSELMKRYHGLLTRFFHNKVADPHDVPDLVSETMLACTRGKDGIRDAKSFRSYLFGAAFNQLRRYYQKRSKRDLERDDFEQCCIRDFEDAPPQSDELMRREQTHLLVHGLRSLPLSYQVILELSMFENLSGRQIGELLELPTATVHTRLRRGKEQLAASVERLAANPDQWGPTVTDLEGWAAKLRIQLGLTSTE